VDASFHGGSNDTTEAVSNLSSRRYRCLSLKYIVLVASDQGVWGVYGWRRLLMAVPMTPSVAMSDHLTQPNAHRFLKNYAQNYAELWPSISLQPGLKSKNGQTERC
jgi:hypothetical protein